MFVKAKKKNLDLVCVNYEYILCFIHSHQAVTATSIVMNIRR